MNVARDIKQYLIEQEIADDDAIYISRVPEASLKNDGWAIVATNPALPQGGNLKKWRRVNTFQLLYRNSDGEALYNKDEALRIAFAGCVKLSHYRTIEAIISTMDELPISADQVHVGSWLVQVTTINA